MKGIGFITFFVLVIHVCEITGERPTFAAQQIEKGEAAAKADVEKLQGAWHHASRQEKGKQVLGEIKDVLIVFRGNVVVFKKGTEVSQVCVLKNIDGVSNPKKVDLFIADGPNEGLTVLGIYEIRDGYFRFCGGVDTRPTSFTTTANDKGYVYCSSYKRVER